MKLHDFIKIKELDFARILMPVFLGMIGAISIFIFAHFMSPIVKVGTVNITKLINQYIKIETKKNISPDELKREVKNFGNKLDSELQTLSKSSHVILFPSEAIIAGGKDYTAYINDKMQSFYHDTSD